jgi:hypothetical protein
LSLQIVSYVEHKLLQCQSKIHASVPKREGIRFRIGMPFGTAIDSAAGTSCINHGLSIRGRAIHSLQHFDTLHDNLLHIAFLVVYCVARGKELSGIARCPPTTIVGSSQQMQESSPQNQYCRLLLSFVASPRALVQYQYYAWY